MTDRCPHYAGGMRRLCYWCHRADQAHAKVQLAAQSDWWLVADALRRVAGMGAVVAALCIVGACVRPPEPAYHCPHSCARLHARWTGDTLEDPNHRDILEWCVCRSQDRYQAVPPRRLP